MFNIKKIAAAALILLAGTGISQARLFTYGVKAGLNVNKLKLNKDIASSSNSCGWTAGFMVDFTVPVIGISADASLMYSRMNNDPEIRYVNSATRSAGKDFVGSPTSSLSGSTYTTASGASVYGKNFLEIPINVKYKFTIPVVASIVKPYIFTGPQFGLRLDKGVKDLANDIESRTFQMNWNVGLGVQLINHLQVSASYGIGCNNVVKKLTESTTGINVSNDNYKVKNNYWTVTAAWLF
ncbi:MAG: PorT family protein [Muribaculaceae bacterium]|nr:PorT family protein [Muribaculaceae bacterium]